MKRYRVILFILMGIIYYSCNNKDDIPNEQPATFAVIGDLDANIAILDSVIYPSYRGDSLFFPIDLDLDGIQDYRFYIYNNYSPCIFLSNFRFDCLHDLAKVYTNDTIQSPEILKLGDTLTVDKHWLSAKFRILDASGICELAGGDGIIHKSGNWFNLSNKYIGLLIEKEGNPIYGWIKLSVPDYDWIDSLTIHEIAMCDKAHTNRK